MIQQTRFLLLSIGLLGLIANNIVLYITFLYAYFFNDYRFSFTINQFGEAHLEFIVLPLTLALGIIASITLLKNHAIRIHHPGSDTSSPESSTTMM